MLPTLPAGLLAIAFLLAAFLSGGYYESTYSLLAAAVWLALAAAAALLPVRRPSAAVGLLVAFGGWTALSGLWGQPGAALRATALVALYAGILLAAEQLGAGALLRAALVATVAVAVAGLVARIGDVAPSGGGPPSSRLAWPVTYANGLGLVAVTGALLAAGLPSSRPRLAAVSAALAGATAYLTFSRSALLIGAAAALTLLALRPASARGLSAAATGIAAVALLDALGGTTGPRLAPALVLAAAGAAALPPFRLRLPRRAALAAALPLVVLAALLAKPIAARFAAPAPDERDARRLLDVSGHGRATLWRVAWHEGRDDPVQGGGAGTWPREYIAQTGSLAGPANAHSLYLESFAELGTIGLGLLLAFVGVVVAAGVRARERPWAPAALAVFAAWALHAATDWDWQLPAATIPALLAAGSLAPSAGEALRAGALVLSAAALALGTLAGLHGVGAALVESGVSSTARVDLAARLLPFDARPYVALAAGERARGRAAAARAAHVRACRIDGREPSLRREFPSSGGCPRSP